MARTGSRELFTLSVVATAIKQVLAHSSSDVLAGHPA